MNKEWEWAEILKQPWNTTISKITNKWFKNNRNTFLYIHSLTVLYPTWLEDVKAPLRSEDCPWIFPEHNNWRPQPGSLIPAIQLRHRSRVDSCSHQGVEQQLSTGIGVPQLHNPAETLCVSLPRLPGHILWLLTKANFPHICLQVTAGPNTRGRWLEATRKLWADMISRQMTDDRKWKWCLSDASELMVFFVFLKWPICYLVIY